MGERELIERIAAGLRKADGINLLYLIFVKDLSDVNMDECCGVSIVKSGLVGFKESDDKDCNVIPIWEHSDLQDEYWFRKGFNEYDYK